MAWQDISSTEIQPGYPITEELLQRMDLRDKSGLEGPAGGFWAEVFYSGIVTDTLFLRLFVPHGASTVYFECMTGATGGTSPKARIRLSDGTNNSYSDFIPLGVPLTRHSFPPVELNVALRGQIVSCYLDVEDNVGSTVSGSILNDLTSIQQGFGVRFGGPV